MSLEHEATKINYKPISVQCAWYIKVDLIHKIPEKYYRNSGVSHMQIIKQHVIVLHLQYETITLFGGHLPMFSVGWKSTSFMEPV